MIWTDIQLGPQGSPRPDVYTIDKSFVNPCPTAYECKVSRADFRSDVTAGKWSSYNAYAHRIIFAAPAGLVTKDDVPEQCGLILRHESAWRYAKRPVVNPRPIAEEALLKLLIDGVTREGVAQRYKMGKQRQVGQKFSKRFGSTAARYVMDAASIENQIEYANQQRVAILQNAEKDAARTRQQAMDAAPQEWRELCHALDISVDSKIWDVRRRIRELDEKKSGGKEMEALRQLLHMMQNCITNYTHLINPPAADGEEST